MLAAIPVRLPGLVVDNNSTDDTAAVAGRHGATVVSEQRAGYGAAVHAGVVAATTPIVAVIDADGSMDPPTYLVWSPRCRKVPIWRSAAGVRCPDCAGRGSLDWVPW